MSSTALDLLTRTDDPWRVDGRCNDLHGSLSHLFFADDVVSTARAKAICGRCPVARQCLETALLRREPWGVWGGELIEGGQIRPDRAPRGRPPSTPRPALVLEEEPVPPHLVGTGT